MITAVFSFSVRLYYAGCEHSLEAWMLTNAVIRKYDVILPPITAKLGGSSEFKDHQLGEAH